MDESISNQDRSFKIEGSTLAHMVVPKVKKKPLPPDLKYEPPHKRKKEKGKMYGKWLDMFKWSPKVIRHNFEDSSLKEEPSWSRQVKLMNLKESYVGGNPWNYVFYFVCVFIFVGIKRKLHNKEYQHLIPNNMHKQMLINSGVNHGSRATKPIHFPQPPP